MSDPRNRLCESSPFSYVTAFLVHNIWWRTELNAVRIYVVIRCLHRRLVSVPFCISASVSTRLICSLHKIGPFSSDTGLAARSNIDRRTVTAIIAVWLRRCAFIVFVLSFWGLRLLFSVEQTVPDLCQHGPRLPVFIEEPFPAET